MGRVKKEICPNRDSQQTEGADNEQERERDREMASELLPEGQRQLRKLNLNSPDL